MIGGLWKMSVLLFIGILLLHYAYTLPVRNDANIEEIPFKLGLSKEEYVDVEKVLKELNRMAAARHGIEWDPYTTTESLNGADILYDLESACEELLKYVNHTGELIMDPYVSALCTGPTARKILDFSARPQKKWGYTIPYVIEQAAVDSDNKFQVTVENAVTSIQSRSCLSFVKHAESSLPSDPYIYFSDDDSGCFAPVGKKKTGPSTVNLGPNCITQFGTAIHEILHVLGLYHEQQRTDRDDHVTIDLSMVKDTSIANFDLKTASVNLGVPYDHGSTMHYSAFAFSCGSSCLSPSIVSNDPLLSSAMGYNFKQSFNDDRILHIAYDCETTCSGAAVTCSSGGFPDTKDDCNSCICPEGYGGTLCDQQGPMDAACSPSEQVLTATSTEQCISSTALSKAECNWKISSGGDNIEVWFKDSFYVTNAKIKGYYVCQHFVEVKTKAAIDPTLRGYRFCGNEGELPTFENGTLDTGSNTIVVHYSTHFYKVDGTVEDSYFTMCYKTVESGGGDLGDCVSNPCQNSGSCAAIESGGYTCNCTDTGYEGTHCETKDLGDCISNPCQNSGSCAAIESGGYTCNCTDTGYEGTHCETKDLGDCISNPCQNSGSCSANIESGYTCNCIGTGYEGTHCETTDFGDCESDPCQNYGSCSAIPAGGYRCNCAGTGYNGTHCQTPGAPCNDTTCKNNGVCQEDGMCDCSATSFIGMTCEVFVYAHYNESSGTWGSLRYFTDNLHVHLDDANRHLGWMTEQLRAWVHHFIQLAARLNPGLMDRE